MSSSDIEQVTCVLQCEIPTPPPIPFFSVACFSPVPPAPPLPVFSAAVFVLPDAEQQQTHPHLTFEALLRSCPICLDEISDRQWTCSGPVKHSFCAECMRQQVLTLMQGQTTVFCCPSCRYRLTPADLQVILSAEDLLRLQKLGQIIHNHRLKECPQCTALVLGNPSRPTMTCHQCSAQFCYFHGLLSGID